VNYLLDTCVVSELTKPRPDRGVVAWLNSVPEDRLHLSVLTLGEIQRGIVKLNDRTRVRRLRQWLDADVRSRFEGRILDLDEETLLVWGDLAGEAENRGKPLPVIDGLLAATAIAGHFTLVTRDTAGLASTGVATLNPWVTA
jgi:predicted nucleic acid-binding protein